MFFCASSLWVRAASSSEDKEASFSLRAAPMFWGGHLLPLEGLALFPEGPGERNHGHLLVEELGLLLLECCAEALQLGALRLCLPSPFLERRPKAL